MAAISISVGADSQRQVVMEVDPSKPQRKKEKRQHNGPHVAEEAAVPAEVSSFLFGDLASAEAAVGLAQQQRQSSKKKKQQPAQQAVLSNEHLYAATAPAAAVAAPIALMPPVSVSVSGTSGMDSRFLSTVRWDDPTVAPLIPNCRRALVEVFKFQTLSKVQAATIIPACKGADVFGKAKTGGGKTLAYLIPALEKVLISALLLRALTSFRKLKLGRVGIRSSIGALVLFFFFPLASSFYNLYPTCERGVGVPAT